MATPLHTLARIRQLQANLARYDLGLAVQAESAAQDALHDAAESPAREAALLAAGGPTTNIAAFAAWLPTAREAITRRTSDAQAACHARDQSAQNLAAAKAALKDVEALKAEQTRAAYRLAQRKTQSALDELGNRPRPRP